MAAKDRKQLVAEYKERPVSGGVFSIRNTVTGKQLIDCAVDLAGSRNRFEFSRQTGSAVTLKLQADWKRLGGDSFEFEILEELKQGENQTAGEFREDLKALKALWLEKFSAEELY